MTEFHPLFPPSDDDDSDEEAPDIQEIIVQRKENAKWVTAPRTFLSGELVGLAQLHSEFGGGEYQLLGRDSLKRIRRRVFYTLPGAYKPMFDEGPSPEPSKPAQAINPMMAMMGGGDGGIMGLVMMMMQQMMQSQQAASQQQSQMMMAFITTMSTGNQAQIQAAQEAMNRQADRDARDKESQMTMLIKLTEAGKGGGGSNDFFKGVEFMKQFSTSQIEATLAKVKGGGDDGGLNLESILETLGQAFQAFSAYKEISGGMAGVPIPSPEVVS